MLLNLESLFGLKPRGFLQAFAEHAERRTSHHTSGEGSNEIGIRETYGSQSNG
jgi:hypothetical protein